MGVGCVLLVHSEIYYVPVDDGWEVVLVRNVSHYVPVLHYVPITPPPLPPLLQNIQQGRIFILRWREPKFKLFKGSTEMVQYKGTDEMRFELMSSCLSDRRFNQLGHGASQ